MQRGIIILSLLFLSSCCKKIVPSVSTQISDSTILKVENYSKQIFVPVNMSFKADLKDQFKKIRIDTVFVNSENEKAHFKIENNQVTINCKTDSLKVVIDSLKRITATRIKTVTTIKNNVIEKKIISWWAYFILGISATLFIFAFVRKKSIL